MLVAAKADNKIRLILKMTKREFDTYELSVVVPDSLQHIAESIINVAAVVNGNKRVLEEIYLKTVAKDPLAAKKALATVYLQELATLKGELKRK